jgi:hypothetical protein
MQGFEGFTFGNETATINPKPSLFPQKSKNTVEVMHFVPKDRLIAKAEEEDL